jgi:hypothetical protein
LPSPPPIQYDPTVVLSNNNQEMQTLDNTFSQRKGEPFSQITGGERSTRLWDMPNQNEETIPEKRYQTDLRRTGISDFTSSRFIDGTKEEVHNQSMRVSV